MTKHIMDLGELYG